LRVEPQGPRTRILCTKTLAHRLVPDAPRRAIFRDLLEEIIMRVEEKRKLRSEFVDFEAAPNRPVHIFDSVAQRERKFLNRGRARFSNVIAADRNRIELRRLL